MELFKKKTAADKATDILTNALHDDEISSFIVIVKKQQTTSLSANGDLFSQAISLVSARRKSSFKNIELLADVIEKAMEDEERKEDGKESRKDTPVTGRFDNTTCF